MKRISGYAAVTAVLLTFSVQAHDVWVTGSPAQKGISAEIGYGHHFPERGTLPDREKYFTAPQMTGPGQTLTLQTTPEAYVYHSGETLAQGYWFITTQMKSGFWSRTGQGWKPGDKRQYPDVRYCQWATKYARSLLSIGTPTANTALPQPPAQELEIVPAGNLLKADKQPVQLKVIYKGAPLPDALVELNSAAYIARQSEEHHHHDHQAGDDKQAHGGQHESKAQLSARTDKNGVVTFSMLPAGEWLSLISHQFPFTDPAQCDDNLVVATLSFKRN